VSYSLPGDLIEGLGVDRATLTAGARNLMLWTKYDGIDPQNNVISDSGDSFVQGIDGWRPGIPRRFNFGIRVGF
jgi:hypothetical protein